MFLMFLMLFTTRLNPPSGASGHGPAARVTVVWGSQGDVTDVQIRMKGWRNHARWGQAIP